MYPETYGILCYNRGWRENVLLVLVYNGHTKDTCTISHWYTLIGHKQNMQFPLF